MLGDRWIKCGRRRKNTQSKVSLSNFKTDFTISANGKFLFITCSLWIVFVVCLEKFRGAPHEIKLLHAVRGPPVCHVRVRVKVKFTL